MQGYVQQPGIEARMRSVVKSKSKNELFRLYACIVKIMLAVSELDGKHMHKARARLSKATGELCAFYLVAAPNKGEARQYAKALNTALERAYSPAPGKDRLVTHTRKYSAKSPEHTQADNPSKISADSNKTTVVNAGPPLSVRVHAQRERTQEERDAMYDPPSPLED
jgi:hypothetical protein